MILPSILTLVLGFGPQEPAAGWFTVTAADGDVSVAALEVVQNETARGVVLLQQTFPELPTQAFRVVLHDSRAAMPPALQRLHHEGSPGFALLPRHEIHIVHGEVAGSGQGFWPVVVHELTHEFLSQHAAPWGERLPRWFHEGFAQVMANSIYFGVSEQSIAWRVGARRLHAFYELEDRFPSDPDELRVAYTQSYSYVAWLERTYGRRMLVDAAARVSPETSFGRALVLETGRTTAELEDGWRDYLVHGSGAVWSQLLGQCWSLTMIFAVPLLALAMIRRMRNDRRVRQRMESAERAAALAFPPDELHGPPLPPAESFRVEPPWRRSGDASGDATDDATDARDDGDDDDGFGGGPGAGRPPAGADEGGTWR